MDANKALYAVGYVNEPLSSASDKGFLIINLSSGFITPPTSRSSPLFLFADLGLELLNNKSIIINYLMIPSVGVVENYINTKFSDLNAQIL